ncbi:MAG: polysaccharide pyruvyl transferase CsaB [Bacillota bacterium]|nr:polysaccharide pyruvyl transferase CsaB [Bacillota bacterium]
MNNIKIMMATMGLGLGGAETHIVELSKALKSRGFDVCICSNGGVYTKTLADAGIRHYQAPMHVRSIPCMIKSFFKLYHAVLREKPDIIHAHARIPAFLSSIVCFLTNTPMVTTAHFNFATVGGLRFLSRWGKRSIAVSNDLKNYLTQNYNVKPENIIVTVNGINTETFSPSVSDFDVRNEFNIPKDAKCIVTVSRMDKNACLAAFRLLDCADELYNFDDHLRIVVVGSGDSLEDIKSRASEINSRLGIDFVIVVGGRTDIKNFCALSSVFVGVSRAALEAMSCEKPVVLAGNQGFLGLYTRDKLKDCIATNFTCRGFGETTKDLLLEEIKKALALSDDSLHEVTAFSRKTVIDRYSVEKMVDDAYNTYRDVLSSKKIDFLICGYYGYHNAGDEALLKAVIRNLKSHRPDLNIAVLLRKNANSIDLGNVKKYNRFSLISILKVLPRTSVMIFGGGNLIQDATSTKSLIYYIELLRLAKLFGLKTMLYANGIGPVTVNSNKKRVQSILNSVDIITLRENQSYALLKDFGVTKPDIRITADEVFTLFSKISLTDNKFSYINIPQKPYIVVSLRNWKTADKHFEEKFAEFFEKLVEKYGYELVFMPMQDFEDSDICVRIKNRLSFKSRIFSGLSIEEMMYLISKSVFVVGMRLHALIFATGVAVPSIAVVYDPKVEGFLDFIDIPSFIRCENIEINKLLCFADNIVQNNEKIRSELALASKTLQSAAAKNAAAAISLLNGEIDK